MKKHTRRMISLLLAAVLLCTWSGGFTFRTWADQEQADQLEETVTDTEPAPTQEADDPVTEPAPTQEADAPVTEPPPTQEADAPVTEPAPTQEADDPVTEPPPAQETSDSAEADPLPVTEPVIQESASELPAATEALAPAETQPVIEETLPLETEPLPREVPTEETEDASPLPTAAPMLPEESGQLLIAVLGTLHQFQQTLEADDAVAEVMALLAGIDSLEEMQAYRVTVTREVFKTANGGYSSGNYANKTAEHQEAQRLYREYVDGMFAKRAAAKEAYDALTEEQKAVIAADETASANLAKLTPYDKLPTHWFTQNDIIIGQTSQTAEQLQLPLNVTPTTDPADPYIYEYLRAYELAFCYSAAGYPCSYAMVDTSKSGSSWSPDSLYEYGNSNYEVVYCCDANVNAHRGMHYRRINLEDAGYYSKDSAAHIRSIVQMAYPYVSIEEMRQLLIQKGFDPEMARSLTRSDMIASIQWAIWAYSNYEEDTEYIGTAGLIEARDKRDYLLMPSLHDYRNEDWTWYVIAPGDYYSCSRYRYTYYEDVKQRVDALTDFLMNLPGTEPEEDQIVISNIEIARTSLLSSENGDYQIDLNVFLNHGTASSKDNVSIKAFSISENGDTTWSTPEPVEVDGKTVYRVSVNAKDGDTVKVVVSGTQNLERGVYFYQTKGGPEESQCFVNVAEGETRIQAEDSFVFHREGDRGIRVIKTAKGSDLPISGISFQLYPVDPEHVDQIGDAPTEEELRLYAVPENLAGTMTTDETGYAFLSLDLGTYIVVEVLNPDKVKEAVDPFFVTIPNPVEITEADGTVSIAYEEVVPFLIENIPAGTVPAHFEVTKDFKDWGKADSFTFQLEAGSKDAPMPKNATAVATEETPLAVFDDIIFDKAGTFDYIITEIDDGVDGVTYDTEPHKVTVSVSMDEDGELSAQVAYGDEDRLIITNTFSPATAVIQVTKDFKDWGKADSFHFVLAPVTEGAPMPEEAIVDATEKQPTASFGTLSFDKAGTYEYTLTELDEGADGVTYDAVAHKVLVTVTKGEKNALSAKVTYDGADSLVITNTFAPATAVIQVTKSFNDWGKADSFTFRLAPLTKEAPMPAEATAKATKDRSTAVFQTLTFDKAGIYEYTVTEVDDGVDGVAYDTAAHKVVVTVTKGEKNALSAQVTYDGKEALTVTNTFSPAKAVIQVTKEFKDWGKADSFTFRLASEKESNPMPAETTVQATKEQPTAVFQALSFDKVGTYEYTLTELDDGVDGVTYDTAAHKVVITVTKGEKNALMAQVTYDGKEALTVTNTFSPAKAVIQVTKEFKDWGKADSFTFRLSPVTEGAPMPEADTAKATKDQPTAVFQALAFDKVGTYEYTLTELDEGVDGVTYDTTAHKILVTVTKGEGNLLSAKASYDGGEGLVIVNTFTPAKAPIQVYKSLRGRAWQAGDRFDFLLEAVTKGAPLPAQTKVSATMAQPTASFGEIAFEKAGTYRYTITEQVGSLPGVSYDTAKHEVVVTVTKGVNNVLTAAVRYDGAMSLQVVNTYSEKPVEAKAEIKVTKQLTGRAWQAGDSFSFRLAAVTQNAPMPSVSTVTATKNNPTVSFGTLTFTVPGTYEYKLSEEAGKIANLTYDTTAHKVIVTVTKNQTTGVLQAVVTYDNAASLTVTNRYTPPTPPSENPKTGDDSQPLLWTGIAFASLLSAFLLFRNRRKFGWG